MDLSKELIRINDDEENLDIILKKIEKEKEVAEQKYHIFSVIAFVKKVKKMAPMLIKEGIVNLRVSSQHSDGGTIDRDQTLRLDPHKANFDEKVSVRGERHERLPWFEQFLKLNENFYMNIKYTENFKEKRVYKPQDINLEGNIEEQLYNVLLSKELKITLDYNFLHLSINKQKTSTENKVNSIKI